MIETQPEYFIFLFLSLAVCTLAAGIWTWVSRIGQPVVKNFTGYVGFSSLNMIINRLFIICHSVICNKYQIMEWLLFGTQFPVCDDNWGRKRRLTALLNITPAWL